MRNASQVAIAVAIAICSCAPQGVRHEEESYREPTSYNFMFIGKDEGIDDPAADRRSYYRIFIDKADEGRTTSGLESQEKIFQGMLEPNRHLVTVEKWVLDEREGRYVKLNNIEQPKPNYIYFDIPPKRIVVVEMICDRDGKARFSVYHEKRAVDRQRR